MNDTGLTFHCNSCNRFLSPPLASRLVGEAGDIVTRSSVRPYVCVHVTTLQLCGGGSVLLKHFVA